MKHPHPAVAPALPAPSITKAGQSVDATFYAMVGPHKCRVSIRSDSYAFQSYARLAVWRPASLDWSFVHAIPQPAMRTPTGLAYDQAGTAAHHFRADRDALLSAGAEILL